MKRRGGDPNTTATCIIIINICLYFFLYIYAYCVYTGWYPITTTVANNPNNPNMDDAQGLTDSQKQMVLKITEMNVTEFDDIFTQDTLNQSRALVANMCQNEPSSPNCQAIVQDNLNAMAGDLNNDLANDAGVVTLQWNSQEWIKLLTAAQLRVNMSDNLELHDINNLQKESATEHCAPRTGDSTYDLYMLRIAKFLNHYLSLLTEKLPVLTKPLTIVTRVKILQYTQVRSAHLHLGKSEKSFRNFMETKGYTSTAFYTEIAAWDGNISTKTVATPQIHTTQVYTRPKYICTTVKQQQQQQSVSEVKSESSASSIASFYTPSSAASSSAAADPAMNAASSSAGSSSSAAADLAMDTYSSIGDRPEINDTSRILTIARSAKKVSHYVAKIRADVRKVVGKSWPSDRLANDINEKYIQSNFYPNCSAGAVLKKCKKDEEGLDCLTPMPDWLRKEFNSWINKVMNKGPASQHMADFFEMLINTDKSDKELVQHGLTGINNSILTALVQGYVLREWRAKMFTAANNQDQATQVWNAICKLVGRMPVPHAVASTVAGAWKDTFPVLDSEVLARAKGFAILNNWFDMVRKIDELRVYMYSMIPSVAYAAQHNKALYLSQVDTWRDVNMFAVETIAGRTKGILGNVKKWNKMKDDDFEAVIDAYPNQQPYHKKQRRWQ